MGLIRKSRRNMESIFIPVSLLLLSFQFSTGYSCICRCQEMEADDAGLRQRDMHTLTRPDTMGQMFVSKP